MAMSVSVMEKFIRENSAQPYTAHELMHTPSRAVGIDADKELQYRQLAAKLIQDMGQRLQVNQLSINTAIVYMHRFYMQHPFTTYHRHVVAPAALFLAAKVEEQPRKLEHVIKVLHFFLHHGPEYVPLDPASDAFAEKAAELVKNENALLQTLGFEVAVDHPHTYVVKCFQMIRGEISNAELPQAAYFMATNSLHMTTMCLKYRPAVVACVCIDIICRWSGQEISGIDGKQWYEAVDPSVTKTMLDTISKEFLAVLEKFPNRIKRFINSESLCQGSRQSTSNGPRNSRSIDGSQRPGSSSRLNYPGYKHGNMLRGDYNREKERRERDHRPRNPIPAQPSTSVAGSSQHPAKHDPSKMPPPAMVAGGPVKQTQFLKREHSASHFGTSDKYQKPYDRSKRPLQDASVPPHKRLAKDRPDHPPQDLKRDFKKEMKREMKKESHDGKREHLPDPRREAQHHGDAGKPLVPEPPKVFHKEETKPNFFLNNNSFNIMAPTEMPPDDIFDTEQNDVDAFQQQTVHSKLKSPPRSTQQSKPTTKPQEAEVKRAPGIEPPSERLSHGNGVHQKPSSHKKEQRSSHSTARHADSTTPPLSSRSENRPAPLPNIAQVSKNLFPSLGSSKVESSTPTKTRPDAIERLSEPKSLPQINTPASPVPKEKSSSHSSHHSKHKEKKKHKSKDRHKESSKEHKKSKKHKKDKHKEKSRHKSPLKDDEGPLKMTFVRSEEGTYTPDKAPPNTSSVSESSTSIPPNVSTPSLKIKIPKSRLPAESNVESSQLYSRDSLAPKVKLKIPKDRSDRDSRKRDRSPNYHKQVHDRKSDYRH